MSTAAWVVVVVVAWGGVGVLVGVVLGRVIHRRDFEVEAMVVAEMDDIDDEYEALVEGGAR